MMVWFIFVAMVLGFFFIHAIEKFRKSGLLAHAHLPLISMSKDEEILYCPGDQLNEEENQDE